MRRRLYFRLLAWKHRALRFLSKSYRDHDAVVSDRERWRRECIDAGNKLAAMHNDARDLEAELADTRNRLKLAIEAQQKAAEAVLVERALRQGADERASRYHDELTDALKRSADWACVGRRGPMYGSGPAEEAPVQPQAMPSKPMARTVAQNGTNETLLNMLADLRNGLNADTPVGPEFATQ